MTEPALRKAPAAPSGTPSPGELGSDRLFLTVCALLGGSYVALVLAMLFADATYTTPASIARALASEDIRSAAKLSFVTSAITAILSLWIAVPTGYLMSRFEFPGKRLVDGILDIPVVLPPMVVGLSLLILFQTAPGRALERVVPITYHVPSVVLAQLAVAAAFAVRTMRVTFAELDTRVEDVALTLGASRAQAFFRVVLPQAGRGVLAAGLLAWARALGEFGPVLVFSGATRQRTEVLPSTVFLELSIGDLEAAVAVSLLLVGAAVAVLVIARACGAREGGVR